MPEIDNLYLDMNGIIHPCTHGNSDSVVELQEKEMFDKIFTFLDQLVQLVRPQKLLFLAIDGVAPRAKQNQQRTRRFRAAQQLKSQLKKAADKGHEVPQIPFDSNCITPGTEFMAKLTQHLQYFIRSKLDQDALWRTPQIILSGHEVPGEGEHKVMEYIRRHKMQPGYPPNLRHCVYGNDADLVMLALATHEPHFVLLRQTDGGVQAFRSKNREETKADKAEKEKNKGWQLLHICMLRDYLHLEFQTLEPDIEESGFAYDLERIVDDFVLLCYFVGNDFLPHLPTLDINTGVGSVCVSACVYWSLHS
jgi:5'-3' exoribonuclease 1